MSPIRVGVWVLAGSLGILPAAARAASAVVAADAALVRTAPREVAPSIATLTNGQQVTVSDEVTDGWRRVELGDGRVGYVQDGQLQVTTNFTVSPAPAEAATATAATAAAATVAAPPAATVTTPPVAPRPRLAKRFIVRPDLNITYKGDLFELYTPIADASSLGLTIGGNVIERLSVEATLGFTAGQSGWSQYPGGPGQPPITRTYDVAAGQTVMTVARYAVVLNTEGHHALTVAAGPFAILTGGFGPTAFAHAEAAYEYRGRYFTVMFGYGANIALSKSPRQTLSCGFTIGVSSDCVVGFDPGDVIGHLRLGIGMTF